jgi:hypothetical protein
LCLFLFIGGYFVQLERVIGRGIGDCWRLRAAAHKRHASTAWTKRRIALVVSEANHALDQNDADLCTTTTEATTLANAMCVAALSCYCSAALAAACWMAVKLHTCLMLT